MTKTVKGLRGWERINRQSRARAGQPGRLAGEQLTQALYLEPLMVPGPTRSDP